MIDSNKNYSQFIDDKNRSLYNKIKDKINDNQNKYAINFNYLSQAINKLNDNNNLNEEEKKEIKYTKKLNVIFNQIRDNYIIYLIINSKINNIYNYKNKFILFMGEDYLFDAFSLINKKFLGLSYISFIDNNKKDFNDFKIEQIISDKIIINNFKDKIIYIIENNDNYNFCLNKKTYNYHSIIQTDDKYLLFDIIKEDKLQFSIIDLSNYNDKRSDKLIKLIDLKIQSNPPKILLNQNFNKFIYSYDDNQLCVVNLFLNEPKIENNVIEKDIIPIKLKKINNSEIKPKIYNHSGYHNDTYIPDNLLKKEGSFSSKRKQKEVFIIFNFEKDYYFNKFVISYENKDLDCRIKKFKVTVYDNKWRITNEYNLNVKTQDDAVSTELGDKGTYLRFDFLENFEVLFLLQNKFNFLVKNFMR